MEQLNNNAKKILDSTIQLLNSTPYDDITIKDICKKAGISRQTFYNYFKNKDEIFKTFFNQIIKERDFLIGTNDPDYFFSDRHLIDIIDFYDDYSDILYPLYTQNILWYLGKDMVISHKNIVFSNISDKYILEHQNYYYLYITLSVSYIIIEWIKTGKKETKEELIHMIRYFSEFRK